jgi:hypothetical protein
MSFFKPSPPPKIEPAPTRDTAADGVQQQQEEEAAKRRAMLQGMASTMLTGSSGVSTELTGTRSLTNG